MAYTITVNGTQRTVDVEADTPLLWVLRDELDLKGTKFGCGMSFCGACTVHVNGVPTRACVTSIERVDNAEGDNHRGAWGATTWASASRTPGSRWMSCSAAIARMARSWPPRRC